MAFDSSGKWSMEDDGVASRVAAITAGGSPLMKQAETAGMQTANRRGLGNSSMAAGAAQQAAIAAATPIASQEAQQVAQKNITQMGLAADAEKTTRTLAAQQQDRLAASMTDLTGQRMSALTNTLNNEKIPEAVRAAVQNSLNDQYQSNVNYLSNLYGVSLSNAGTGGASSPGSSFTAPPGPTDYAAYVRANPDLLKDFAKHPEFNGDIYAYGQWHWSTYGKGEPGRAYG